MIDWLISHPIAVMALYAVACFAMFTGMVLGSELLPDDTEDH